MSRKKFKPISEQTIVITGASSGIGLATATLAAGKGARVVISSRNEADLVKIADLLNEKGGKVIAVKADVTRMEDLEKLCHEAIHLFGGIDTWINNAGGSIYGPLLEVPEAEERQLFETNFWGVRNGCRVAVEALKERGGVIINLGSEVSARSIPMQGIYCATKHAVKAYTDALRMELEHDQVPIAVSLIRPTAIDTPFAQHAVNHLKEGEPSLPSPAYEPQEVARAILSCAEFPKRDIFVGAPARLAFWMEAISPRLADRLYGKVAFKEQSKGTLVEHQAEYEGLIHPPHDEGHTRGGHLGKVKKHAHFTSQDL